MKAPHFLPVLLMLAASGLYAAPGTPPRLNVLYIISDDLDVSLGSYGHPHVKSPHIDRLASRGIRFDRAYCNYPVCNPSRASFLSGRRPGTTRVVDNFTPSRAHLNDAVFLPEHFRRQGYRTIKVGKIFHTGDAFEDPRSWDVDVRETSEAKNPPKHQILRRLGPDGFVLRAKDEDTWEGKVARVTVEHLAQCARESKPFFLAAGFRMPHRPYIAPEKYYALYNPDELKPRPGPPGHLAEIPDLALTYRMGVFPRFPQERPGDTLAGYYAAISYMDAQVGVLLEAMDRLNLWSTTLVVFHSDHGYHMGEHGGLWHKLTLFEESTRVPLIVAMPAVNPGVARGLVELVDLYPTLAELCGLPIPGDLEGTSFAPLLKDPAREWKRAVFAVVSRPREKDGSRFGDMSWMGRTVFDGRWRYTQWPDGTAELYDHDDDPYEYANLASSSRHRSQLAAMKKLMASGWKAALPPSPTARSNQ